MLQMSWRVLACAAMVLGPIAVGAAGAQPAPSPASGVHLTVRGGIEPTSGGQMHEGATGAIGGIPVEVEPKRWTRSQKQGGLQLGGDLSYGWSPDAEAFVSVGYLHLTSKDAEIGTTASGRPLMAVFDSYSAWELGAGLRWFLPNLVHRTFVGGFAGVRRVSPVAATLTLDGGALVSRDVPIYEDSLALVWAGSVGMFFGPAGFELGIKYTGNLSGNDEVLGRLGLASINDDSGNRWSVPVSFVYRF